MTPTTSRATHDEAEEAEVMNAPVRNTKRHADNVIRLCSLPDDAHLHNIAKIATTTTTIITPDITTVTTLHAPPYTASGLSPPQPTHDATLSPYDGDRTHVHTSQVLYFSPCDVNKSLISLGDPLINKNNQALTPTQTRHDPEPTPSRGFRMHSPSSPTSAASMQRHRDSVVSLKTARRGTPITLQPGQVDRLVEALAKCPLIHTHVSRQWWDDDDTVIDDTVTISDTPSTPSLTTGSSAASSRFYIHPNGGFLTEQRSASVTEAILEEEFARNLPDHHPKARHPIEAAAAASRSTRFGGIALADPKVHGAPIRFISENYRLGANVLQVGACTFLNIPYGTTVQSHLRVEPPSKVNSNCRIMLQVVNQVLERRTGKKTYLLVAELDATESFTRAALTELADRTDLPLSEIQILHPAETQLDAFEEVDWCALADDSRDSVTITDMIESAARSFASLDQETCTMQTLTLLSELERLKTHHQDFLVVRPTAYHPNRRPSGLHVPWISQHLDHMLLDDTSSSPTFPPHHHHRESSEASRVLRDRVVAAVAEGCAKADGAFDTKIWWGDQWRAIHCVLLGDGGAERRTAAAWVCFLSGEFHAIPCEG
ncbi:hypothetical protein Tdes44962_MAKER05415 [Teratosphaeria destructans]|uniref:Uncharacterized protein n=1 Tax=Teratosphaeria destructans TaxID=418781 RepID=A0A9W7SJX4_9PEZI|nr:hypothetical protein Tdes44962_MAKER05415 [Teratosphaeria destructans]